MRRGFGGRLEERENGLGEVKGSLPLTLYQRFVPLVADAIC